MSHSAPPSVRRVPDRKVGFRQNLFAGQADTAQPGLVKHRLRLALAAGSVKHRLRLALAAGSQRALDVGRVMRAVDSNYIRTVEASVSADPGVHSVLEGPEPRHVEWINPGGGLPDLARTRVNPYVGEAVHSAAIPALAEHLRRAYTGNGPRRSNVECQNRDFKPGRGIRMIPPRLHFTSSLKPISAAENSSIRGKSDVNLACRDAKLLLSPQLSRLMRKF